MPGVTPTKWRRIWGERYPRVRLELVEVEQVDQRQALTGDQVDMCFVRLPVETNGLHLIPLYEEVAVVVVGKDHPVSLFEEVSLADLSEETILEDADPRDAFDLVAGGAGVLFVPHSIARSHSRRDLVYRPVSDAEPTRIALAWPVGDTSGAGTAELVEDFIGIVRGRTVNSSRTATPSAAAPRSDGARSTGAGAPKTAPTRGGRPARGGSRPAPRRRSR